MFGKAASLGLFFSLFLSVAFSLQSQQRVTVQVKDRITGQPLEGATIKIFNSNADYNVIADAKGSSGFNLKPGRYQIMVSYAGYQSVTEELLVIAGKQSFIDIVLYQSDTVLEVVEINGSEQTQLPGLQSISIEKTLRVPANFFDPVRMITSYPSVVAANDQNNSIIIRGNSPNGLLWRLNGLDIVNPNHLANAGSLSDRPAANGGGVNILSAQMLDRTDFFMGAFPAVYGNALAGIIDMNLREGNNEDFEFTTQASLIGLDFAAEGPIGKDSRNSFLANYRYSTVGLLSALGVNFGDEAISFQDLSFNTSYNYKNGGELSLFGLWGDSKNRFNAKEPIDRIEDKDAYNIDFDATTYAVGLTYNVPLRKGQLITGLSYSSSQQQRNASMASSILPQTQRRLLSDSLEASTGILSGSIRFKLNLKKNADLEMGIMNNYQYNRFDLSRSLGCNICGSTNIQELDGITSGWLLQPFVNATTHIGRVSVDVGLRYVYFTFSNDGTIEPRLALKTKISQRSSLDFSYSHISQVQTPQMYLAPGNADLDQTKSHHLDLAYNVQFSESKLKTGVFYQALYDVPIESTTSTYSALNVLDEIPPPNLVNGGTGKNYGIDATFEQYFVANHYFIFGGSVYESKYKGSDNITRDSRFNGNYTFTGTYGKEWVKTSRNRTIGLSTRVLYLGGLRESAIDESQSESEGETSYNTVNPFANKLDDYFRVDLRLSFRKNKPGYTRTLALDIQNVSGQQNQGYHYFDFTQDKIVTKYQLGIIPVLVYRVDF